MLSYMMLGMRLDVPPPFSGLLPPPVYGGEQQAPYVYGQYPGYISGVDKVVMVMVDNMDGIRQEVQECSREMSSQMRSDGDRLEQHISFYDYFILCYFSSSIGLY
ncbi:hypothetical protein Hanom_Chr00s000006g01614501 [Helianthus anomalus]